MLKSKIIRIICSCPKSDKSVKSVVTKRHDTMKKETWKFIIQTIIAILTAIATSLGVTSCMGLF